MKIKPKVSIIVPIFNAELYLDECILSLVNQDYKNIEIILIDDGSTDRSLSICNKYANNENIIFLKQSNKGVSAARNKAINYSTGEYIMFVDSDDYCSNDMVSSIIEKMSDNKLISFGYTKKYVNKEELLLCNDDSTSVERAEEKIILDETVGGFVWNKVFSSKIIKNNNIMFDTEIHYCEDTLFVKEYLTHCDEYEYIKKNLYYYRVRKSSASFGYSKKGESILKAYEILIRQYDGKPIVNNRIKYNYLTYYYKNKKEIGTNINQEIINNKKLIISNEHLNLKNMIKNFILYKLRMYNLLIVIKYRIYKPYI